MMTVISHSPPYLRLSLYPVYSSQLAGLGPPGTETSAVARNRTGSSKVAAQRAIHQITGATRLDLLDVVDVSLCRAALPRSYYCINVMLMLVYSSNEPLYLSDYVAFMMLILLSNRTVGWYGLTPLY